MKEILLASNNKHKVSEFRHSLEPLGFFVYTPADLGIHFEVEETGSTFEENATLKSERLFELTKKPSLADDSGICVIALGGKPGVYSARFGNPNWSDRERAIHLLNTLEGVEDRSCFYYAALAFTTEKGTQIFKGRCDGSIAYEYDEVGKFGFGYDPIFIHQPTMLRFSRIPPEEKFKLSHRGNAIRNFLSYLNQKL
ncbi:MAG: RdgB/HAM1 family non-canonical purine NTP pyrophosphatase [Leptospiraceae bacterium]|nr:RdgB/HAM1 family non-canonical purine NTP pyrophosphatase [Leptospiraceae bacterium]